MDRRTLNALANDLRMALEELRIDDVRVSVIEAPDAEGEVLVMGDGISLHVKVVERADLRPDHADALPHLARHQAGLVFADRIAVRARESLVDRGWGWLDRRRGHLRLWRPGLRIDAPITPRITADTERRVRNVFSPAGMKLALWLLLHPGVPASPRGIARELEISPGQVSNLLSGLHADALLRRDKTPLIPELFWALVEHWWPRRYDLLRLPDLTASEMRAADWRVTDARAGDALGAPLVLSPNYPLDFYLPDAATLSWVLSRSELAPDRRSRSATVALAPTPLAVDPRFVGLAHVDRWACVHPVVAALDLAGDRARGRESVQLWDPDTDLGVQRVW